MSTTPRSFLTAEEHGWLSPLRLVLAVVASTFIVELLIMDLIPTWARGLSQREDALLDATVLCLVITPVLLLAVYRPLSGALRRLDRALGQLKLTAEIVEKATEAILITDENAKILYVNRSFSDITGYTAAEAIGNTPRMLKSGMQDQEFYADMWSSLTSTGEWQGEIWNRKKNGEVFPEFLSVTRIALDGGRTQHYVAIFTQAHHDHLTGLANRHLFLQTLTAAVESRERLAVVFLDLDGFKGVNDTFGHGHGDRLLRSVGLALKKSMRAGDLAARFGGDEFVVLLRDLDSGDDALSAAERIRASIEQVARRVPEWAQVTASVGVAIAEPDALPQPLTILQRADQAMYAAKREGKNRISVSAPAPAPAAGKLSERPDGDTAGGGQPVAQ